MYFTELIFKQQQTQDHLLDVALFTFELVHELETVRLSHVFSDIVELFITLSTLFLRDNAGS